MNMQGNKVINGLYTEIWLDGELLAEAKKVQAKITLNKEDVVILGKASKSKKVVGWEGKGTITLNKVNSRMAKKLLPMITSGKEIRSKIITMLADPDSYGAERCVIGDVLFDDLTIIDAAGGALTDVECPFTFESVHYEDMI